MQDYIPRKENNLIPWSDNLKDKIEGYAGVLDLTQDEVKLVTESCANIDKGITSATAASAAARKAAKEKKIMIKKSETSLRTVIQRIKKSEGYTLSIGEDLNIIGSDDPINPDDYKTKLSAKVLPGKVCIRFIKKGVEGVNIYGRAIGSDKWIKLDFASRSPYADKRPLAVAGTAEVRQYMAIGVLKDTEIGLMSDILEVVYGG